MPRQNIIRNSTTRGSSSMLLWKGTPVMSITINSGMKEMHRLMPEDSTLLRG